MKLIYKARDITEAHIVSGLLNANGIETHVGGHYLQGGVGDLSAMDFANIHVADADILLAESIISEYEGATISPDKNANIGQATKLNKLSIFVLVLLLILIIFYLVSS